MSDKLDRKEFESNLIDRWSWLLGEGLDKDVALNTAIVLDSSYKMAVNEGQLEEGWLDNLLAGEEDINEAGVNTSSRNFGSSSLLPKVLFPVIRRFMPELTAHKLVSVQPIPQRTGIIYHIDFGFVNDKEATAGKMFPPEYGKKNIDGKDYLNPGNMPQFYSSEKLDAGYFNIAPASGVVFDTALQFTIPGARFDSYRQGTVALNASAAADAFLRVEVYSGGSRNREKETIDTVVSPGDDVVVTLINPLDDGDRVLYVYDLENSVAIPEMEFFLTSETVETTERKLKVRWTKESEQDMMAYHKINVEHELVKLASQEMNYEVDREIINYIEDQVQPELAFDHMWGNPVMAAGTGLVSGVPKLADDAGDDTGDGGTTQAIDNLPITFDTYYNTAGNYLDRHRALAQKIYMVSAEMIRYNRQGGASWAVVAPQMAALLKMIPSFEGEVSGNSMKVNLFGKLGSIDVYVDPNKPERDSILFGFKSNNSQYGAGVVYAPYTSWMSNTVTNPDNFNSIRGFFSRYAIHKVHHGEWFYSSLKVNNFLMAAI